MQQIVLSWFPSSAFANLYGLVVLVALLSDEIVPRLTGGKGPSTAAGRDRGSFLLIYAASFVGLVAGLYLRYRNVGVVPSWVQGVAMVLVVAGAALREWAIAVLGRFFSRTVSIEQGHRLITSGPFRWIRHPAYTGMLFTDSSVILGLGTWVGALLMFILLLGAALYRIRVEERALLETFGDEYRAYMRRTALLFPPW
ncbi:MAG TPA: isoprenylcysteine carboxylmethyltransferase family protein [Anaerolineales bacterium]